MLPTKFWAEMSWRDFAATDMSKVVAVLPVAAVEQHGPHLPVGVDMFINEGYLARAVKRIPDDMPVLILPVQAIGKSNEHIEYPGTLTLSIGDGHSSLDGNRRKRRANRVPQAHFHEFARRKRAGHRRGGEGVARPAAHARRPCRLAPTGVSGGPIFRLRTRARHSWRRRRDLADARLQTRHRAHERSAKLRQRGDFDRAGIPAASRHPADRIRVDVERPQRTRRGRRRRKRDRGQGRSLRRERRGRLS